MEAVGKDCAEGESFCWPADEEVKRMGEEKLRVSKLNLKYNDSLQGIQLVFDNGTVSPFFETEAGTSLEAEECALATRMRARTIGFNMSEDGKIQGLNLENKAGKKTYELLKKNWSQNEPKWYNIDLPQAKEIVGLYGKKQADAITSLGFLVAVPNYAALVPAAK